MNIMGFGYFNILDQTPPRCVTDEPLEKHLPNLEQFQNIVLATTFYSGPSGNPTAKSWVFYFYRGEIDQHRRPDDILTFKIKTAAPGRNHIIDKYLGGPLFGAKNAKPLSAFPCRKPTFVGGDARQNPEQLALKALQEGQALSTREDWQGALAKYESVIDSSAPLVLKAVALWAKTQTNEQIMHKLFFPQGKEGTDVVQSLMTFLIGNKGTPEARQFADLLWEILLDMKAAHDIVERLPGSQAPEVMAQFMSEYEDNEGFFELFAQWAEVPLPTMAQVKKRQSGSRIARPKPDATSASISESTQQRSSTPSVPDTIARAGTRNDDDAPGWEELQRAGFEHVQRGEFSEAVSCWKAAVETDPPPLARFDLHANIGAAHVDMIREEMSRSTEEEQDQPAFIERQLQRCTEARTHFLTALSIYLELPSSSVNHLVEQKIAQIMELGPQITAMRRTGHRLLGLPEPDDDFPVLKPTQVKRSDKGKEGRVKPPKQTVSKPEHRAHPSQQEREQGKDMSADAPEKSRNTGLIPAVLFLVAIAVTGAFLVFAPGGHGLEDEQKQVGPPKPQIGTFDRYLALVKRGQPLPILDESLSCDQLWQLRNWVFARHGYAFPDGLARQFFDEQPDYERNEGVNNKSIKNFFMGHDEANRDLIYNTETSRGCR
jgi:tetratricopeptide (TPR) repeat protein